MLLNDACWFDVELVSIFCFRPCALEVDMVQLRTSQASPTSLDKILRELNGILWNPEQSSTHSIMPGCPLSLFLFSNMFISIDWPTSSQLCDNSSICVPGRSSMLIHNWNVLKFAAQQASSLPELMSELLFISTKQMLQLGISLCQTWDTSILFPFATLIIQGNVHKVFQGRPCSRCYKSS